MKQLNPALFNTALLCTPKLILNIIKTKYFNYTKDKFVFLSYDEIEKKLQ